MRWKARIAGLSVVAAILTMPLAAHAGSLRTDDAPPLEGEPATTAAPPAEPPSGQVVTIIVPGEPEQKAPPKPKQKPKPKQPAKATTEPPPPPPPPPPVSPPATSSAPTESASPLATSRGGASSLVVVPPPARGGPSFSAPIARSRQTASVTAVLASPPNVAKPHAARLSRGLIAVLGAAAFAEALLITRMLRRRHLGNARAPDLRRHGGPGR